VVVLRGRRVVGVDICEFKGFDCLEKQQNKEDGVDATVRNPKGGYLETWKICARPRRISINQ